MTGATCEGTAYFILPNRNPVLEALCRMIRVVVRCKVTHLSYDSLSMLRSTLALATSERESLRCFFCLPNSDR
jgi:hypothetical protein